MRIPATELELWFKGAESEKPEIFADLIADLVALSTFGADDRYFQHGGTSGKRGWDGFVNTSIPFLPFVPAGKSYWEFGTNEDFRAKAEEDYVKRTGQVSESDRLSATFIFATPMFWPFSTEKNGLKTWIDEKTALKEWGGVKVIHAERILEWLEHFPALKRNLFKRFGRNIDDLATIDERWLHLSSVGYPPYNLLPDVFLAGKDNAARALFKVLDGDATRLRFRTNHIRSAGDFVSAYCNFHSVPSDARARIMIVTSVKGLENLVIQRLVTKHILVLEFETLGYESQEARLIDDARSQGHSIIFSGRGDLFNSASIDFPRAKPHQFQSALEKSGYPSQLAKNLVNKSEGDVMLLLAIIRDVAPTPSWTLRDHDSNMASAALIGRWGESEAEIEVIQGIVGKPFGEWIGKIRQLSEVYGAPLIKTGENWRVSPRYEAWLQAVKYLDKKHLENYAKIAVQVLTEIDPKWSLPTEQQFTALIYGKKLKYSQQLRLGLVESLALIGSYNQLMTACPPQTAELLAHQTVEKVLDSIEPKFWATIDQLLPYLAEASPRAFMDAVKKALRKNPSPFQQLFDNQQDDGFSVTHQMTGLLWALETIAWNAEYLSEVVSLLGELATIDPGGRLANRPSRSLITIFLPWLPQTVANSEAKFRAIKKLLATDSKVGFELLKALLPRAHQTSSGSRRPVWREWIPENWPERPPRKQYYDEAIEYANLYVEEAFKNAQILPTLVRELENLPQPAFQVAIDKFLNLPIVDDSNTQAIWQAMFELVLRNSKYQNAQWSLKGENLEDIRKIEARLRPVDPIKKHYNIFSLGEFDYYDREEDYDAARKRIQKEKTEAIKEIIGKKGVEGLISFAQLVKNPYEVGRIAGSERNSAIETAILPKFLLASEPGILQFVAGYIPSYLAANDWAWVDNIKYQEWSQDEILQFYLHLPFRPETWRRLEKRLPERQGDYWRRIETNFYATPDGLYEAAENFLTYERPARALDCLFVVLQRDKRLDAIRIIEVLKALLKDVAAVRHIDPHEISVIFKSLQQNEEIEERTLIQLEWAYLGFLGKYSGAKPVTLERAIANDPESFCEVLRLLYRSSKDDATDVIASESQKSQATNAWHLLNDWSGFPGFSATGFDPEKMKKWVSEVISKCTESGHLKPALIHLAHAAARLEKHRQMQAAVLELLDQDSENGETMRSSFRSELFNLRGVYTATEGREELEISNSFDKRADEVAKMGFDNLARTFRDIRDQYKSDSEREAQEEW